MSERQDEALPFKSYKDNRVEYLPWEKPLSEEQAEAQKEWQRFLREEYKAQIGKDCFISTLANIYNVEKMVLGDQCLIGADTLLRNISLEMGEDCSINTFSYLQGKIRMGNMVRIGPKVSIIGTNHGHSNPHIPIIKQSHTQKGIEIGDDIWIGANAVIVDGVRIGSHSIIAAGAVVTKDIPEYSVAGGNPARIIKNRLTGEKLAGTNSSMEEDLVNKLRRFGEIVKGQYKDVLKHYVARVGDEDVYLNQPEAEPTVRAWCDAVEIAAFFDDIPAICSKSDLIHKLSSMQTQEIGYNVLTLGYALEVLGSTFSQPFFEVENMSAADLYQHLDSLPWKERAWESGAWVDHYGTALYFNKKYFASRKNAAEVFGWLILNCDQRTGLWGASQGADYLQPVNGFYRLTRGTYAQFGIPLPYPETVIDTVLAHSRNANYFGKDKGNACHVLDVIHPLWLCGKQTDYRREEGKAWALKQISRILNRWVHGKGFSFQLELTDEPGLQGTEMWLSILFLLAEYCGLSQALGYRPKGVHRIEVALDIRSNG
ncbi:MAG: acyltransferase [Clostridia bacterium]|nr:acyltransferase [Clostridia bacterium]